MKIDILQGPPADIFRNRRPLAIIFAALLAISLCGLLMGAYAIVTDTKYYDQLEKLALIFFVAPSPFAAYVGEKLQQYKKLTPPQQENLLAWIIKYPAIKLYCDQVVQAGRQPVRAEYEACQDWVEAANRSEK